MPSENAVFVSVDQEKFMLDQTIQNTLLDIRGVCRSFPKGSGEDLLDRKSTRLNSSHLARSRMPSSA